jgi:hypothetical protein
MNNNESGEMTKIIIINNVMKIIEHMLRTWNVNNEK